ncbi:hypothetical protein MFUL124B02_08815 [Myxococcus fulvus 124B02]|nr:hypothetical protein MFUL124B02_08815 [Myxococcus fulvus 124B02]
MSRASRLGPFVREYLVPTLRPGDLVVMDNLGAHHATGVKEAIRAVGTTASRSAASNRNSSTSDAFQNELCFLGAESSPSFVRSPEGNGCAERFIRTLKEQLLRVRTFATVEELRQALLDWAQRDNEHWLLERHDFLSPRQARRELMQSRQAA